MGSFVMLGLPIIAWLCIAYLPVVLVVAGLSYYNIWTLNYSKFSTSRQISSRAGMFILYTGGIIGTFAVYLAVNGSAGVYIADVAAVSIQSGVFWCLVTHFVKRWLEVLFVHSYSSGMGYFDVVFIFVVYCTWAILYSLAVTVELPVMAPITPVAAAGIVVFVLGELGNLYHHILLANLRNKKPEQNFFEQSADVEQVQVEEGSPSPPATKRYYMPTGGLFGFLACPHYFCEVVSFVGISMLTTLWWTSFIAAGVLVYLSGRAKSTLAWYKNKFPEDQIPARWRAIIPCVL